MSTNEYMKEYMRERWRKRRASAVEYLGGKCVVCGTTRDLEFDHIDPDTKIMSIAKASSKKDDFFWEEVRKCQLLCKSHHLEKSRKEAAQRRGIREHWEHGTTAGYRRGCRCEPCLKSHGKYMREYVQRIKEEPVKKHGVRTGYDVGCRCEPCKEAKRRSRKK